MKPYEFASTTEQDLCTIIWDEKYRNKHADGRSDEASPIDSKMRMVSGVYKNDPGHAGDAAEMAAWGYWLPGGRVLAGAGTGKHVTITNCFANMDLPDSMPGIMDGLTVAALSLSMGGGIGTAFGSIRPRGAVVVRKNSVSSGVIPFMEMYDAMSKTVRSSGSRRGAQMATLPIWHPDVLDFIEAKHTAGALTTFNVSVLVPDAFMDAVAQDTSWDLRFTVPPAGRTLATYWHEDREWFVYKRVKARELWEKILRSTYDYSEPGVIFIDRVNRWNPMYYAETINVVNPCGEQPLPELGNCNLGHLNQAFMVENPFTSQAHFQMDLLREVTTRGVRFLDNVADVSLYPTSEMRIEALQKRRMGIGFTGLGSALQQMQIRYGSQEAQDFTRLVSAEIRDAAYRASIELAKERGSFPAFKMEEHLEGAFVQTLPEDIRNGIRKHGLRNATLLSVAPVGTGSMLEGNVTSGLEPTFAWRAKRAVIREDGARDQIPYEDFGYRLLRQVRPEQEGLPEYMVTAGDLTVQEHLEMQAAAQPYVDGAISKTINCPEGMPYEDFAHVYDEAWRLGLKGVTTYRPSPVRGSVICAIDGGDCG